MDDSNRPERAKPYPKDILIFSPHPDDDVISMGGTFQRLIKQGHNVHVAYETSGCIAVDDSNLQYFLDFMNGYKAVIPDAPVTGNPSPITLADYTPRQILDLKALIRRGEATAADRFMGLSEDHIHFLNLPFYETGTVKKGDLTQRDVDIVKNLLMAIRPHELFVAGDLADPHGTHKVCLDAVLAALDELKATESWLRDCRIWMYRGAWMEWEVDLIEMAVPMKDMQEATGVSLKILCSPSLIRMRNTSLPPLMYPSNPTSWASVPRRRGSNPKLSTCKQSIYDEKAQSLPFRLCGTCMAVL